LTQSTPADLAARIICFAVFIQPWRRYFI